MSHDGVEVTQLGTIEEMLEHLTLRDVTFFRLNATNDGYDEGAEVSDAELSLEVTLSSRLVDESASFRAAFKLTHPRGVVEVDGAVHYDADTAVSYNPEAAFEFADNVALMTLFPYIRQQVADVAARVGVQMILPILPRGALSFRPADSQPDEPNE